MVFWLAQACPGFGTLREATEEAERESHLKLPVERGESGKRVVACQDELSTGEHSISTPTFNGQSLGNPSREVLMNAS